MDPRLAQRLWMEQVRESGFPVGDFGADLNALAEALEGTLVTPAEWLDAVAVYAVGDEMVLVGALDDGPWAVVTLLKRLQ